MAKKESSINYLDEFIYFHIAYQFVEDNKTDAIIDKLSKISLSEFKDVKVQYDLEFISLLEVLISELSPNPYLTFEVKDTEIYLSKKKIAISYPKNLMKGKTPIFVSQKLRRLIPAPRLDSIKKDKQIELKSKNLTYIDNLIKVFLIPKILENNLPEIKDITIIFNIEYNHKPKLDSLDQIIEKNFFEGIEFKVKNFDFEITKNKNKFYFEVDPDSLAIMCVFIYNKAEFSIFEKNIEDLLQISYNKFKEIIEVLKL